MATMRWSQMTDFAIDLPNRPGELARLAARLRAADVNLLGLWGAETDDGQGTFYCVPESSDQFREFARSAELDVREGLTFYLRGEDYVGALVRTLEQIAGANVNLLGIQTIAAEGSYGCFVWADENDWDRLVRILDEVCQPR
ncbi:MAG: hypothetical protein V2J24_16795 [Pseudomonadales bacterium]|jgi:hypothetical protein|nr:hypothetical protein [Pseudomonadales bacterium]